MISEPARKLADRVGAVSGGASGIGRAVARELAGGGACLLIADLDGDGAARAATEIEALGGRASSCVCDVRIYGDLLSARDACLSAFGRVDFIVANAGVVEEGAIVHGDPERWRAVIETNVLGVALTVKAFLPALLTESSADIVLVSSLSGRTSYAGQAVYIASKWAVVGLGHALQHELHQHGVRVTIIEPGLVETSMARSSPLGRELLGAMDPLAPEDVARAVAYALCQPPHVVVRELAVQALGQAL